MIWREYAQRHGWAYRLWDEAGIAKLGAADDPAYCQRMERGDFAGAVDVARYHLLLREGGLYLDCDWVPVGDRPPSEAIPATGLSAIAETTPRLTGAGSPFLNNSVIAAPPGHPALQMLIDRIPEVIRRLPEGPAWWVTGPLVFTLAARSGPMTVLDSQIACGVSPPEASRAEVEAAAETLARSGSPALFHLWKPWEAVAA